MKNNKGFISISVVYSFFVVFLLLLLFIVNNLVNNRILLNNIKDEIKNDLSDTTLSGYLINHAQNLIKHDSLLENSANDNSYRFYGSNPDNYVCFGSDVSPCPQDNLYRIIGIFSGQVKLIKNTSIGSFPIDTSETNTYINTTIYNYLNTTFLTSLEAYSDMIVTATWLVDGINNTSINSDIAQIFLEEVGSNQNPAIFVTAKIGLMYVSDYGYGTNTNNYNGNITGSDNWLNNNQDNWTNTRDNTTNNQFFYIASDGTLKTANVSSFWQVRPTFFLNSTVRIISGDGTIDNPYRVEEGL